MKSRILSFGLLCFLMSCKTPLSISNIRTEKNIFITDTLSNNKEIENFIQPYRMKLEGELNTIISHTDVELNKEGNNSNLGNLLSDFTLEGASEWAKANNISDVDGAVINIGGIRTIIPKGDIAIKQIFEVMPFDNEVVIVKIKGEFLQGLFDYYLKTQKNNPVSKINIKTEKGKLLEQLIGGKEIDPNKTYYLATSDYLATGGDSMFFFGKGEIIFTGIKMRDLFLDKFKQNPKISAPNDVRLNFVK